MKRFYISLLALLLSGCASIDPRSLENSLVISADCSTSFVVSKWWKLAFGSEIRPSDTAVITGAICKKGP